MAKFCPIHSKQTDENIVRLNALLVVALLGLVLLGTPFRWLTFLLAVDFGIRGFGNSRYSLITQITKPLVEVLNLPPRPINLAPKQFAARIGFTLSSLAAISFLAGWAVVGFFITSVILVFAFLEGGLGFCVACLLYPFVVRLQGDKVE